MILIDTNVLVRCLQPDNPMHKAAVEAIASLTERQVELCLATQNLIEFWVVCTRPSGENGLGQLPEAAFVFLNKFRTQFRLMPDSPAVYQQWESLVVAQRVAGKNAHDARLVACMMVNGVSSILTFNVRDFVRFAGVQALDPASVAAQAATNSPTVE